MIQSLIAGAPLQAATPPVEAARSRTAHAPPQLWRQ